MPLGDEHRSAALPRFTLAIMDVETVGKPDLSHREKCETRRQGEPERDNEAEAPQNSAVELKVHRVYAVLEGLCGSGTRRELVR